MVSFIDSRRLAVGAVVLIVLALPLYLFVLRPAEENDPAILAPALVETPPSEGTAEVGLEVGMLAPDFEISTTDGRRVRLSDFRGRPVVVNFFALWCTSCLAEMPEIKAELEERGLETFAVFAINAGETRARALEFVDFLDAPFTYGLDTNLVVSDAYRVLGLPASVFIDSQGVIQTVYAGYAGPERFDIFLDAAINAQPPGELPLVLRMISTIPRDRVLSVETLAEDELKLTSRGLRCDAGYCGVEAVVAQLESFAGVSILARDDDVEPSLTLRFDPDLLTREEIAQVVVEALEASADPVYERPVTITYVSE